MKKIFKILLLILTLTCQSVFSQTQTSEFAEEIITYQEVWSMGSEKYNIEGTSLLEGKVFIVRALWSVEPTKEFYEDAIKIAQFALVKGYRNNAKNLRFSNQFSEVDMENIGVALIEKTDNGSRGFRFMLSTEEVLGTQYKEGTIELPTELKDKNEIKQYGLDIWDLLYNYKSEILVGKFNSEVMKSYSEKDLLESVNKLSMLSQNYSLNDFSHSIFLGRGYGGRYFNYIYWLSDEKSNGFLTLTLLDKDDSISILGVNITSNSFIKK